MPPQLKPVVWDTGNQYEYVGRKLAILGGVRVQMMADYTFPSHEHAGAHGDDGICHTWKKKRGVGKKATTQRGKDTGAVGGGDPYCGG